MEVATLLRLSHTGPSDDLCTVQITLFLLNAGGSPSTTRDSEMLACMCTLCTFDNKGRTIISFGLLG